MQKVVDKHTSATETPVTAIDLSEAGNPESAVSTEDKKNANGERVDPQPDVALSDNTHTAEHDPAIEKESSATEKRSNSPSTLLKLNDSTGGSSQDISTSAVCELFDIHRSCRHGFWFIVEEPFATY